MHCDSTRKPIPSVLSLCILLLALMSLCLLIPATSSAFPLEEDFEEEVTAFDIPADSGWGVAETHGPWTTFRGSRHLDNNVSGAEPQEEPHAERVIRAILTDWITIPPDSANPTLSFCDAVRVAFREKIDKDGPGRVFVIDDFRISDLPAEDADDDGIPDAYDPTPNDERLPPVEGLQAFSEISQQAVYLEWTALDNEPLLAGYRLYRRKDDETKEVVLNKKQLIPADQNSYVDTEVQNVEGYHYRVVAVSKEGHEGGESASGSSFAFVAYNLAAYPYEESFDSVEPTVAAPEGSGWAVAEDHGDWKSFSGNYHLDSNPTEGYQQKVKHADKIVRAAMQKRVHIPEDAIDPRISYWYRLDLTHEHDEIQLDLHYIEDKKKGDEKEKIKKDFRKFKSSDNTGQFKWESLSLEKYRGTEIWLVFRQKIDQDGTGGVFILDDLRIGEPPAADANGNGIPDAYESPMNAHMLPYVKNFTAAAAVDKGAVQLNWSPIDTPKSLVVAGYNVFRSRYGAEAPAEKVNVDPLGPQAAAFTDTTVENDAGYYYYVTGLSTGGDDGYPSRRLPAYVAYNDIPVANAAAQWDQGVARLTWDPVEGVRYRLYRGPDASDTPELAETETVPFTDTTAEYYYTYYYRFATIKDFVDPFSDLVVQREGPLSAVISLTALPVPRSPITGAGLTPDGTYTMRVGAVGTYSIGGTYEVMTGEVVVTATQGDVTLQGSGSDGSYDIQLTGAGQWRITVSEKDGWMSTTTILTLTVDDQPPLLSVDGPAERTTGDDYIVLSGAAADTGSGLHSVFVTSDRYAGQSFGAVLDANGAFTCEVPLRIRTNRLAAVALDGVGNQTSANITVTLQLTAVPAIAITSPAAGATVLADRISVAGEVRSSLPPEQIRLVLGDQMLFPSGANGEYSFQFDNVSLLEGANTLEVRAETVYGNVSAQTIVNYLVETAAEAPVRPTIAVESLKPGVFLTDNRIVVNGTSSSELGIAGITVNGQQAEVIGTGTDISFQYELQFPDGDDQLEIVVAATDSQGHTETLSFTVQYDNQAPAIQLTSDGVDPAPAVN
ncbi:MAG: hypothetical protein P8X90_31770, partial [Desulfobacterales bacterium]